MRDAELRGYVWKVLLERSDGLIAIHRGCAVVLHVAHQTVYHLTFPTAQFEARRLQQALKVRFFQLVQPLRRMFRACSPLDVCFHRDTGLGLLREYNPL